MFLIQITKERISINTLQGSVLSLAGRVVMEGLEGRCQGDFWGWRRRGGIIGRWGVTSDSLRDWEIVMREIPPRCAPSSSTFLLLSFSRLRLRSLVIIIAM